jgi:hypothetical protein
MLSLGVIHPADPQRIDLILKENSFRIDIREVYPTLIRGNQTWKCHDYEEARALAMRIINLGIEI